MSRSRSVPTLAAPKIALMPMMESSRALPRATRCPDQADVAMWAFPLRHHCREDGGQQEIANAGHDHRQRQADGRQRGAADDAGDRADLAGLRAANEGASRRSVAEFVCNPGLLCAIDEGIPEAPYHLCQQDGLEAGERPPEYEAEPDEHESNQHRQAPADGIGERAGRHLKDEAGRFEGHADEHEL
jgi:hypothetical protein